MINIESARREEWQKIDAYLKAGTPIGVYYNLDTSLLLLIRAKEQGVLYT